MPLVQVNWSPDRTQLRRFGLATLVGFGLLGLALQFLFRRPTPAGVAYVLALVVGGLGLTGTRAALPFYWALSAIALVVGSVIGYAVLVLVYYGLIAPMGLWMRLMGRDRLRLRRPKMDTYWEPSPPLPGRRRYERQF